MLPLPKTAAAVRARNTGAGLATPPARPLGTPGDPSDDAAVLLPAAVVALPLPASTAAALLVRCTPPHAVVATPAAAAVGDALPPAACGPVADSEHALPASRRRNAPQADSPSAAPPPRLALLHPLAALSVGDAAPPPPLAFHTRCMVNCPGLVGCCTLQEAAGTAPQPPAGGCTGNCQRSSGDGGPVPGDPPASDVAQWIQSASGVVRAPPTALAPRFSLCRRFSSASRSPRLGLKVSGRPAQGVVCGGVVVRGREEERTDL